MAVGLVKECEMCGVVYDEGRDSHWFKCDGGKARKAAQRDLEAFNSSSVDARLEFLYRAVQRLTKEIDRIPFSGPIG